MKEEIFRLRDKGYTFRGIAKELGCSSSTVYRCVHPKPIKVGGNVLKKELADKIRELSESGVRPYDIMQKVGVSYTAYQKYGKPYYKNKFDSLRVEAIKLRKDGMLIKDIAIKLDAHQKTISNYVVGIKPTKIDKPKVMKLLKRVKKEIVPHEVARDYLGKGFEKGEMPTGVKLREDRDFGRSVSFMYSDFSDNPTVRTTIMVRDSVSDDEAVERWCKKLGKKSWKLIK